MIIKGNTVGTPMPRTDYTETNENKSTYLKGKSVLDKKIANAESNASEALGKASQALQIAQSIPSVPTNALLKSGGTMTGVIDMNGNRITGLPAPTQGTDLVTVAYLDEYFLGGEW